MLGYVNERLFTFTTRKFWVSFFFITKGDILATGSLFNPSGRWTLKRLPHTVVVWKLTNCLSNWWRYILRRSLHTKVPQWMVEGNRKPPTCKYLQCEGVGIIPLLVEGLVPLEPNIICLPQFGIFCSKLVANCYQSHRKGLNIVIYHSIDMCVQWKKRWKLDVGPAAAPTLSLMDLLQFFTGLTHAVPALHSF